MAFPIPYLGHGVGGDDADLFIVFEGRAPRQGGPGRFSRFIVEQSSYHWRVRFPFTKAAVPEELPAHYAYLEGASKVKRRRAVAEAAVDAELLELHAVYPVAYVVRGRWKSSRSPLHETSLSELDARLMDALRWLSESTDEGPVLAYLVTALMMTRVREGAPVLKDISHWHAALEPYIQPRDGGANLSMIAVLARGRFPPLSLTNSLPDPAFFVLVRMLRAGRVPPDDCGLSIPLGPHAKKIIQGASRRAQQRLEAALEANDAEETLRWLALLGPDDVTRVFNVICFLRTESAFLAYRWIAEQPRPDDDSLRDGWLRALNNGCNLLAATDLGTQAERTQFAFRAMSAGSENPSIFHNAACLFCTVGEPDAAIQAVAQAIAHGCPASPMADDADLDLVRSRPEFKRALAGSLVDEEEAYQARLARVRRAVLAGQDMPRELELLWKRVPEIRSGTTDTAHLTELIEFRARLLPADVDAASVPVFAALESEVLWVAEARPSTKVTLGLLFFDDLEQPAVILWRADGRSIEVAASLIDGVRLLCQDNTSQNARFDRFMEMLRVDDLGGGLKGAHQRAAPFRARVANFLREHPVRGPAPDLELLLGRLS